MTDAPQRPAYTVTQLTEEIAGIFQEEFRSIAVEGEISGWKLASSGHAYFSLKDENALLKAVMWRSRIARMVELPSDGQLVRVVGGLTVYPPRGEYQIDVQTVSQAGVGLLQQKFEELKRRLEAEGLFAPERKRDTPFRIKRVGVITSPTGAALRDFLRTLANDGSPLEVLILPARVQGLEAPAEIVAAIRRATGLDLDVLVVTRGGGSLEDLWSFNEESVARAIAASPIPVISAVGHEVDFTIADFVADVRVATPTAAAMFLIDRLRAVYEPFLDLRERLAAALTDRLEAERASLQNLEHRLRTRSPLQAIAFFHQRLDDLTQRGGKSLRHETAQTRSRLASMESVLRNTLRMRILLQGGKIETLRERLLALNPAATLARGYALIERAEGSQRIRSKAELPAEGDIRIHWSDGSLEASPRR